jgi:two-component system response regulator AtoC
VLIKDGKFREDLYYRIKVINITLPPLRERKEDIPLLVNYFLRKYLTKRITNNPRYQSGLRNATQLSITNDALALLMDYSWPGNVRELGNEIQRAVTLAKNQITPEVLSSEIRNTSKALRFDDLWERFKGKNFLEVEFEIEKELIRNALEKTKWNQMSAAKILGLPRTTLQKKMRKLGLKKNTP